MRSKSKIFDDVPHDDGLGTCLPNGDYEIKNPDPEDGESNKPDIPFFARAIDESTRKQADWAGIIAAIGVKRSVAQDLSTEVTAQRLRLRRARKVIQYHTLCARSHQVTVSGHRLRLWKFTPTCYLDYRAFHSKADHLDIGRIQALHVVSDTDSILRQRAPATSFEVRVPGDQRGLSTLDTWEWIDATRRSPALARPHLWGSRTAIFAGPARRVRPARRGDDEGDLFSTRG